MYRSTSLVHPLSCLILRPGVRFSLLLAVLSLAAPLLGQEFAYVANSGSDNVTGYMINPASGALTLLPTSPFPAGSAPYSVTADPTGSFLYVANADSSDISAYAIGLNGDLTLIGRFPTGGFFPTSVAVDPTGKFLYVANYESNTLTGFRIDPSTGALESLVATVPTGIDPYSIAIDPKRPFVYVSNQGDNSISGYRIETTGALSVVFQSLHPPMGNVPAIIAIDPTGRFLYVPDYNNQISAFKIENTGNLTLLGSLVVLALPSSQPTSVAVDSTGRFAFVTNEHFPYISWFSICPLVVGGFGNCSGLPDGSLSPIALLVEFTSQSFITVDVTGKFLYAANDRDGSVSGYADPANPEPIPGSPFAENSGASPRPLSIVTVRPFSRAYQIHPAFNLTGGDSVLNLTNDGGSILPGTPPTGDLCANIYVFDPDEELIECCSCLVSPNGLKSLSVRHDLISNTLTSRVPNAVVIKLLASKPTGTGESCNPASPAPQSLAPGMHAWGTTIRALPTTPVTYGVTEGEFTPASLSPGELTKLTGTCGFIQGSGSGRGVCKLCKDGGR